MPPEGRRATDFQTPDRRANGVRETIATHPESDALPFPLFSDTPFMNWNLLHRKYRLLDHLHPSCQPLIKLWDEANGD